jgi:hypothetical protein
VDHLRGLLSAVRRQVPAVINFRKVHGAEFPIGFLEGLGFRPAGSHRLYAATARGD